VITAIRIQQIVFLWSEP